MLGSSDDDEVLVAARALVKELESTGEDLNAMVQAWEHRRPPRPARPSRPPRPKPKPFDFTPVKTAVDLFVAGKSQVKLGEVRKAALNMLAEVHGFEAARDTMQLDVITPYIRARLRQLGFQPSPSARTWSFWGKATNVRT
jgi:hypothetical protein